MEGVLESTDGGGTWGAVNTGLPATSSVGAFAISPGTVYAFAISAAETSNVLKSTDGGGSWAAARLGLTNAYVGALAIDPSTPSTLYATPFGHGVFKSTDGGSSWAAVNAGLTTDYVGALAVDPTMPGTLYVGTAACLSFCRGDSVFKSTDGATSWAAASAGLTNPIVHALAIDPSTPRTLYARTNGGVNGGVFKSTDGGNSWIGLSTGLANYYVNAVVIDPTMPTRLYTATAGGGCSRSSRSAPATVRETGG